MAAPLALLTDFGLADPYTGVMKGVILSINPGAVIVDLTHGVPAGDILRGAFFLARSVRYFPTGTIFIAVVDPGVGSSRRALAVQAGNRRFVAPDNGLLTMILESCPDAEIYEIANPEYLLFPRSNTFHGRDVFAPAAAHLSIGVPLHQLGPRIPPEAESGSPVPGIVRLNLPRAKREGMTIRGTVLFADHFGNLITNISKELLFPDMGSREIPPEAFERIGISIGSVEIPRLSRSYSDTPPGESAALIGSYDTLEIAVNGGSAEDALGSRQMAVEVHL